MFWRFGGYANISTIDTLLDKPDATLEELLDETDLIQELKAQNAKLVEFLRDEAILERLLKYVIAPKEPKSETEQEPATSVEKRTGGLFGKSKHTGKAKSEGGDDGELDKTERQRLKNAYISCEILSSDVWSIAESILESPKHLKMFWDYMKSSAPLDPLQAGYFTKVNESLLEKKTEEMIAFIKTLDHVVPDMMKHVDCPMVMDLLLKLISLEKDRGGQGIVDWLQEQGLVPILLAYITADHSAATQTSAGDFLKAIITISANATGQDNTVIGPNELTRQLVSDKCVEDTTSQMLKGGSPLTVGVGIIIEVIRKNNSDYDSEAQIGPEPKSSDPIYLGSLLRIFAKHIPDFMELILSPRHSIMTENGSKTIERQDLKVAWGDKIEPLGFDRFKTCELMAELLHCSNMGLLNERGTEEEVRIRDAERESSKAQGKLAAAKAQAANPEFGTSMDSSGLPHDDEYVSLSVSPNDPKGLAAQAAGDEDGFEKVAMSDVQEAPDHAQAQQDPELPQVHLTEVSSGSSGDLSDEEMTPKATQGASSQFAAMNLDEEFGAKGDARFPKSSSGQNAEPVAPKKRLSLLSQQIQADRDGATSKSVAPSLGESDQPSDTPAPLFSSNPFSRPTHEPHSEEEEAGVTKGPLDDDLSADVTPRQDGPSTVEQDDDGSPVVGDLLKMMFVENKVVPIILDFFFRFPWNNFLHNVVYDVVQQVFNGGMDRGYNRNLAIDLFKTGRITERIIEGQQRSAALEREKNMRLGYMGHLTLIAEEVVKFTDRQAPDLLDQSVIDKVTHPDWIHYVEHILADTRERDNAILGGIRPDAIGGPRQAVLNAVNAANAAFNINNYGGGLTSRGGLDLMALSDEDDSDGEYGANHAGSNFGNSSDEEEEDRDEAETNEQTQGSVVHQEGIEEDQITPGPYTDITHTLTALGSSPTPRARERFEARIALRQLLFTAPTPVNDPFSDPTNDDDPFDLEPSLPAMLRGSPSKNPSETLKSNPFGFSSPPNLVSSEPQRRGSAGNNKIGGFAADFQGFEYGDGNDDAPGVRLEEYARGDIKNDTSKNDEADDDDDPAQSGLKRQTTHEALKRRPLDSDDEDNDRYDSEEEEEEESLSDDADEAAAETMEPVRPVLAVRRTHSGEGASSSTTSNLSSYRVPKTTNDAPTTDAGEATSRLSKLREQERVRNYWGTIPAAAPRTPTERSMEAAQLRYEVGEDGDDEDDEDDEVIEMGTKYMRRGSRSSNGSGSSI